MRIKVVGYMMIIVGVIAQMLSLSTSNPVWAAVIGSSYLISGTLMIKEN